MFATYVYSTAAVPAEVKADLFALICGADVNSLSNSCVKAMTTRGGGASGWAAHDVSNGVIKGMDSAGADRFARLTVAALLIKFGVVESWNAVAHTGVNPTTICNVCNVAAGVTGTIGISANDEAVAIWSGGYWAAAIETGRDTPLITAPYPVALLVSSNVANLFSPRIKNPAAAGDILDAPMQVAQMLGNNNNGALRGAGEVLFFPVMPLGVSYASGFYGWLRDVFMLNQSSVGQRISGDLFFDTVGKQFICLPVGASLFCYGVERR